MTGREPAVRTFRPPHAVKWVALVAAVIFLAVTVLSFRVNGWSWVTIVLAGIVPLGVAGFLDTMTQRVELHPEHLVVVRNLMKASYPRNGFTRVTWAKGVPVSLQLTSGKWVQLPGVGTSSQGLVNTLRAWIRS